MVKYVYKEYNPNDNYDVYTLGQAWHQYIGTDLAYRPRQSFIASVLNDILPANSSREVFLAVGREHWISLNETYDKAKSDMYRDK